MTEKETIEIITSMAEVTVPTLSQRLEALTNGAEMLLFTERFGSNTILINSPLEGRFLAQAHKESE
jgi:hypothetical protein